MFAVLLAFVALNLFLPGESSSLSLILSQAVIYGFAGLHLAFVRTRIHSSPWMLPAAFVGLAAIVSQVASLHGYDSLRLAVQFGSYILLVWLVAETAPAGERIVAAIAVLVAVAAILSIVGLLQVVTFFEHPPDFGIVSQVLPVSDHYLQQVYAQKRIFSTFILPTSFSTYLAMMLPLGLGLTWHVRTRSLHAVLAGAATLLMLFALVQAQSHGGPVALAIGGGLALIIFLRDRGIKLLRTVLALGATAVVVVLAIGFIRGHFLWDLEAVNSPIRLRWKLWQAGSAEIGEHWMTGIGSGNFPLVLYPHLSQEVRPTKYLHNSYLQIPLEFGAVGGIAMLLALILLVRSLHRRADLENEEPPPLRLAVLAALCTWMVANGIEIVLYFHSLGLLGAFFIGLWLRRREHSSPALPPATTAWIRFGGAALCAVALLMLGRWFLADHFYSRAADMLTRDVVSRVEQGEVTSGEPGAARPTGDGVWTELRKLLQIATTIDDGNYRYHLLYARAAEQFAPTETNLALAAVSRAITCNPALPSLYYSRALLALRLGRPLDAAVDLAQAEFRYPGNGEYQRTRREVELRINRLLHHPGGRP